MASRQATLVAAASRTAGAASRMAEEEVVVSALARPLPRLAVALNLVFMAAVPQGRVSAAAEVEVIAASVTAVAAADFFPVRLPAR
jgi:hypothetical protein